MTYRADIDGLRAIAVLGVVLFHAHVPGLEGGYVGVDVFFVISGFLITSILKRDMEAGTYTLSNFYERRAKRIFPALFFVLIITTLAAAAIQMPQDFKSFGESILSTLLFASNMYFFFEGDYFAGHMEFAPLLHTWSLGVEEQFYIFFPVFLFFIIRYAPAYLKHFIALSLLISFILCLWASYFVETRVAFYFAPLRAWELLIGSALAVGLPPALYSRSARDWIGALGLGLIALTMTLYNHETLFPGHAALWPCLGAAMVIYAGQQPGGAISAPSAATRLLSLRPVVWVGLISFSLYLWHWPLLVFPRYIWGEISLAASLSTQVIAVVLAALSLKYVEAPFRHMKETRTQRRAAATGLACVAILFALGAGAAFTDGASWRVNAQAAALDAARHNGKGAAAQCFLRKPEQIAADNLCVVGAPDAAPKTLIWGDSHALALHYILDETLKDAGLAAWAGPRVGCGPLLEVNRARYSAACADIAAQTLEFILRNDVKRVFLVAWWTGYTEESLLSDPIAPVAAEKTNQAVFTRGFNRTIDALRAANVEVVLFHPVPAAKSRVPLAMAIKEHLGVDTLEQLSFTNEEIAQRNARITPAFDARRADYAAEFSFTPLLCQEDKCDVILEGAPVYSDRAHLSQQIAPVIRAEIERQLSDYLRKAAISDAQLR